MQNKREISEEEYLLADEQEREWRKFLPRLTDRELIEIFAPTPEMIRAQLQERERECYERTKEVKEELRKILTLKTDETTRLILEIVIKIFHLPDLEQCTNHMIRLKRLLRLLVPDQFPPNTRQEQIEKARQYPIYEMAKYRLVLRKCGNKFSALCPFHNEKHASFYLYPETNTFHCFGCQENGDMIKLAMHLHGISFGEAVRMLQ